MGERKADLSLGPFINYPNRFNKICLIPTPRLTYGSEPRSKRDMERGGVSACLLRGWRQRPWGHLQEVMIFFFERVGQPFFHYRKAGVILLLSLRFNTHTQIILSDMLIFKKFNFLPHSNTKKSRFKKRISSPEVITRWCFPFLLSVLIT